MVLQKRTMKCFQKKKRREKNKGNRGKYFHFSVTIFTPTETVYRHLHNIPTCFCLPVSAFWFRGPALSHHACHKAYQEITMNLHWQHHLRFCKSISVQEAGSIFQVASVYPKISVNLIFTDQSTPDFAAVQWSLSDRQHKPKRFLSFPQPLLSKRDIYATVLYAI